MLKTPTPTSKSNSYKDQELLCMRNSLLLDSVRLQWLLAASMHDYYPSYTRDHNQQACMSANEGLAYISLPSCASNLPRSLASWRTNSLLIPWLHYPFMCESCDKNVTMPLCGEMASWEKTKVETSPSRIFPPVCIWVGKSCPPNVTEISSLIATGCSCFWQEVRVLQLLHKSNSFANWCTRSTNQVPYHDDEKVSIHPWEKFRI